MSRSTRTQDRGTQGDSRSSELRSATVQTREDYGSSSPISPNDWERTASTSTVTAAMTPIDPQPTSASSSRSRRPRNISGSVDPQRTETGVIRTTPGNVRNRFQPAPTSRKKNMMDERERKKLLENDEWTAAVDTHNVVCKGCGRQVSLDKRSRYYPGLWLKHRGKCMEIKRLQAMRGTATTSEVCFRSIQSSSRAPNTRIDVEKVRQPSTPQTTAREESPNQRRRPTQGPGPALQQFDRGMNPRRSQPYPAPSTSTQSQGRRASTSATSTNALSLRTQVNEARGERLRLHRADFQHDARARTPRQEENEDRDEDERILPSRTRSSGTGHEHNDDDEKYSHGRAYRR
ncbi:hypothetical protein BDN72DRAFT_124761 [Pluteus cervinus]|uniref:Uncharacterized protein n=1 Tax=Pluteus cervinus TaxID=181527 RepID=A0ACD3AN32_9AGAR|nr:hypothetical protein BDN72DRAFT_124761 [Pluteus cervinus]